MSITINLKQFITPLDTCLVGKDDALTFIKKLEREGINIKKEDEVTFIIPEQIVTINLSFFYQVFSEEVLELGSVGFKNKYKFISDSDFMNNRLNWLITQTQDKYLRGGF